jgi:hypothetical protein
MKFRQFLRHSFQNAVDKYQEDFFKDDRMEVGSYWKNLEMGLPLLKKIIKLSES